MYKYEKHIKEQMMTERLKLEQQGKLENFILLLVKMPFNKISKVKRDLC